MFLIESTPNQKTTASDTLTLNGSLLDGQTLVSRGNSFELGFFSLGKPMYRYLGISYKNISVPTVVWVANGDFPLLDKSGVLEIGNDGNLVLLNSTRDVIWSSGLSTMVNGTVAQLLDSGNLVLMESSSADSENYLWQSFDSPSNTGIPGTKIDLNVRTGEEWYLRSWKDWDDPSPGDFTFKLDNPELPQLVLRNLDVKKLRFGPWNGVKFIGGGIPTRKMNPILPGNMVSGGDELYLLTRTTSDNIIARALLNETGLFQEFYWDEQTNQWVEILMLDKYKCGNYGFDGISNNKGKKWVVIGVPAATGNSINLDDSEWRSHEEDLDLPLIDFDTIKAITCDFADTKKIGQGGFGPVYKALLHTGQEIAVKRLSKNSRQGLTEFKNEAWNLFNERKTLELLDPSLRSLSSMSEVSRCIQIGLLCVQRHAKDRPTMSSALSMLDSENALMPQPKEPGFYSERFITELSTYDAPITGNKLTITFCDGR
ncbi:Bulb-type lectin domain [Dillenia turbinata]|uniref:Bulb-type lectin domain n=1 Tax=Dillenia turbinata TaxID=194707 RepID=A0AAN8WEC3_9MAGN